MLESTDERLLAALAFLDDIAQGRLSLARALGLHPKPLAMLFDKAIGLVRHGRISGELELLHLAHVDGTNPMLPFWLANARQKRGDYTGAVGAYGEALRRAERMRFEQMVPCVRMCRAAALAQLGELQRAAEDLREVADTDHELAGQASTWLQRLGSDRENTRAPDRRIAS